MASKSKGLGEAHPQTSVKRVVLRECGKRRGMRLEGERGPDPKGPCLLPEGVWSFMWKREVEGDFFLQPTRGDLDSGSSRGTERGRLPVNTSEKKIDSDVRRKRRERSGEGSERSSSSPLTTTGNRKPVRQEARAPARLRPKGRCFGPVQFGQLQGLSGNSQSPG